MFSLSILRGLLNFREIVWCGFAVGWYGWQRRWSMAIAKPSAIDSGTWSTSSGNEISPVLRSTVHLPPGSEIENIVGWLYTSLHSFVSKREKNLMVRWPGLPGMPRVPLVPGPFGATPGIPLTYPSHFPMHIPQSLLPLIKKALSPSFKVQFVSLLLTWFCLGSTWFWMRWAVLTTFPSLLTTTTEESCKATECITRYVNASRFWLSNTWPVDVSQEASGKLANDAALRNSVKDPEIL